MKPYDKYKDSGIEWIGEIPEHWTLQKYKHLFIEHSGSGFPHDMQGKKSGNTPFYKVSDLNGHGDYVNEANNYVSTEDIKLHKWNMIPEGSILTAKIGEALRKNHRKICLADCVVDNNCLGLEPKQVCSKYAFYLLKTVDFDWFVNPGAVPSVSMDKLRSFYTPVATTIEEQTTIATYLDRKTAEIDLIIANKQKLIALYEEEKQAVINQAVTKGLNPNAKMKDSGVEWLGEIPEHWEVKKLKRLVELITEKADGESIKIGLENIESQTGKYIETNADFEGIGISFNQADILYGKLRPYLAKVWSAEFKGAAVGDFFVLRPLNDINSQFLKYNLLSTSFTDIANGSTYGAKMPRVNWEFLSDLNFTYPIIKEQLSIVAYIESESARLDTVISKFHKQITLLQEYRTTLISEVVTGKMKVVE